MLRRVAVFLICSCLSVQFAFAGQSQGLSEAFNDLKFDLTVEWNQQDQSYAPKRVEIFLGEAASLGVTPKELATFVASEIKDEHERRAFRTLVGQFQGKNLSMDEIRMLVSKSMEATSHRGAQWSPNDSLGGALFGVAFILTVGVLWYGGLYLYHCNKPDANCPPLF